MTLARHGRGGRRGGIDKLGERAQTRVIVEVTHGSGGVAVANAAHEGGRGERRAAQREEVRVRVLDGHAEDLDEELREPGLGVGEAHGLDAHARQRPRQGLFVDLTGGAHGQLVHDAQARDEGGGHGLGEALARSVLIEAGVRVIERDIAHEDLFAASRGLHRDGRVVDIRQGCDVGLDLAELDAAAANLHLVVDAPHEVQAVLFEAHVVARAVCALPRHGLERRVLFGVLDRVEVARETHTGDDELAHLAHLYRKSLGIHDRQVPAAQRLPDAHRAARQEPRRRGHDGGLRGAVGIPHLAVLGRQAVDELLRTGFAADDEQAHVVEGLRRPQTREGRDGGDHRDVAADEPGAEIHAGAHERAWRRDKAAAVAPCKPHFLTARVEGDGQAREHAVIWS